MPDTTISISAHIVTGFAYVEGCNLRVDEDNVNREGSTEKDQNDDCKEG